MNAKYPSFVNEPAPEPDYDCRELRANGYNLRVRCNKNNPDCQRFIEDKKRTSDVKIIELDSSVNNGYKNMIDIWTKKSMVTLEETFQKMEDELAQYNKNYSDKKFLAGKYPPPQYDPELFRKFRDWQQEKLKI